MEEFNLENQQTPSAGPADQPFEVSGQFAGGQSDINTQTGDIDFDAFADMHFVQGTMPTAGVGQEIESTSNYEAAAPFMQNVRYNPAPGAGKLHDFLHAPTKPDAAQLNDQHNRAMDDTINAIKRAGALRPSTTGANPDPTHYSRKATNMDKYYLSNAWKTTSFHPFANNTDKFEANMDWSDHNSLMWTQYGKMYWPAVTSSWRAIGDMFGGERSYVTGDYSGAKAFEDAMRIGGGGGMFNDILLQSAYTMGVISSIAIEEAAIALAVTATGGGGGVTATAGAARTVWNVGRGLKTVGQFGKRLVSNFTATRAVKSSWQLFKDLKRVDNAKDFWRAGGRLVANTLVPETYGAIRTLQASKNVVGGMSGLAKTGTTFGGFYRDFRALNLAVAEAKLEGGMVHQDLFEQKYLEYKEKNKGQEPTDAAFIKIKESAIKAEYKTVQLNAPFILLTNRLTIGTALAGFKGLAAMTAEAASSIGRRIIFNKKTVGGVTKAFTDGGKQWWKQMYNRGAAGNFKQLMGGALYYGQSNVGEGIQELYQEAVANGVKDYYSTIHDDPAIAGSQQIQASTWMGAESMLSAEGAHVFASGFLMGGVVMGPQKVIFQWMPQGFQYLTDKKAFKAHVEQREAHVKESVKVLNEMYSDQEGKYFDVNMVNAYVQKHMSEIMMQASAEGNVFEFHDARDGAIFTGLNTMMVTGKAHLFEAQMEDYLSLDDEGIQEAFATEVEQYSVEKVRSRLQKAKDRIKSVEKAWKTLNDELINPHDENRFKVGTTDHNNAKMRRMGHDQVKMLIMFNTQMAERAVERYNALYQEISESTLFKNVDASDVDVLTSVSNMHNEITSLSAYLEVAQTPDVEVTESDYTMPASIIEFEGKLGAQRPQETDKEQVKDEEGNIVQEASKGKDSNVVVKTGNDVIKGKDGEYKVSWTTYRDGTTTYTVSKLKTNQAGVQKVVGAALTQAEVDALFKEKTTTKAGEKVTEDEYVISLSEDERAMYTNKQKRLGHLQKIFEILTDKENLIARTDPKKVSSIIEERVDKQKFESDDARAQKLVEEKIKYIKGSQETQFGFFDRRKTPRVRQAILDYLNFVAGADNIIADSVKFDELIKKIMDYKSLNGRAIQYGRMLNLLLNPQSAVEFGDKMALSMTKAFRENRSKVEGRVRKSIARKETNQFLNNLADIQVYPEEEEVKELLKDPEIVPINYLDPDGLVTPGRNLKKFNQVTKIVNQYRELIKGLIETKKEKATTAAEKEKTSEAVKSLQDQIDEINEDDIISDAIEKAQAQRLQDATDQVNSDKVSTSEIRMLPAIKKVLARNYEQYLKEYMYTKNDKKFMSLKVWAEQGKVKAIAKALSELFIVKHLENDTTDFGKWLEKNRKRIDVEKIYMRKYSLSYGDIAITTTTGFQRDVIKPRQKVLPGKNGIHILEISADGVDQFDNIYYRIVNDTGEYLSDTEFDTLQDAKDERTAMSKKAAPTKGFTFEGRIFHTNDIVVDKNGEYYFVISKKGTFNTDLFVAPLSQRNSEKITGRKKIKDGAFDKNNWKVAKEQPLLKDVNKPQKDNVTLLVKEEPLNVVKTIERRGNFPGFYTTRLEDIETAKEAKARQQKMLRDLTPIELANLTIKIAKNPGWVNAEKVALENRKTAKAFGEGYVENEQIKKHAQKYAIEVINGEVSLGYMQGHTVMSLLDVNGDFIFPEAIEEQEVKRIFRTYKSQKLKDVTKAIRQNYLQAQYIDAAVEKLIKDGNVSQTGEAVEVKLSDISGVTLKIMKGSEAFANAQTNEVPATFEELEYKFIDGKEDYFVMQLRSDYSHSLKARKKERGVTITNANTAKKRKEYNAIYADMAKTNGDYIKKHYGGYVAIVMLPNGTRSFVGLKAAPMKAAQSDKIIEQIKEQMDKTTEKNVTYDDAGKPIAKDIAFNHEFNDNLITELFIANKTPGTQVQLRVTPWGKLQVVFLNKHVHENKDGKNVMFERSVGIPLDEFKDFKNTADFINHVNNFVSSKRNEMTKGESDEVTKVAWNNFTLALGADAFRASIPTTKTELASVVYTQHLLKAQTTHSSKVRKDLKLVFQVNDTVGLDTIAAVAEVARRAYSNNNEKVVEKHIKENAEHDVVEPMSETLANAYVDKDSIPENVAKTIAEKMIVDEALSPAEVTLYEKFLTVEVDEITQRTVNEKGATEQNKEDALGALERATNNLEDYLKTQGDVLIESQGLTEGAAWRALEKDPEVIRLRAAIDAANSAFKIVKGVVSGQDVLDIEDFKIEMLENLPEQFSVEEIAELGERLQNGNMKLGEFAMHLQDASRGLKGIKGVIKVGKLTAFKKHEAFHGVFRMLLTDAEIKRYLKLARKEKRKALREEGVTLKDALDTLSRAHPAYAEMTRSMLEQTLYEEYMADQFDMFKENPSSTPVEMRSLFQRIIDAIRAILGLEKVKGLRDLYQGIESGIFANAATRNNMFTRDLLAGSAVSANKILSIPMGTLVTTSKNKRTGEERVTTVPTYIPADIAEKMIFLMRSTYQKRRAESSLREETLMDQTIDDVIHMYDIETRSDFYDNVKGVRFFGNDLKMYHKALVDNKALVKEAVLNSLGIFVDNVDEFEDSDEVMEEGYRSVSDYDKTHEMYGGFGKMNQQTREYIAMTTLTNIDDFGNTFIDPHSAKPERVDIPVDHKRVYNLILKSVRDSKNDTEVIRKMALYVQDANSNNHSRAFVEKFFNDMGFTFEEVLTPGWNVPETVANPTLFQSVVNAFRLYRAQYHLIERDAKTGVHHVYDASKSDDENAQIKIWASKFRSKRTPLEAREAIEELHSLLQGRPLQDRLTEDQLSKLTSDEEDTSLGGAAIRIAKSLNEDLGMNLSSMYIKYSIIANIAEVDRTDNQQDLYTLNKGKDHIEKEDLEELLVSLEKEENPYKDYQDDINEETGEKTGFIPSGVKGRVRSMALNNAQFDESVGESTFTDAEGNKIWAHQHSSFHMEKIVEMNDPEWLEEAKEDDTFKFNNLINDAKFETLIDEGGLVHIRAGGHRIGSLSLADDSIQSSSREGHTYGNQSARDFMINMLSYGVSTFKRVNPSKTEVHIVNDETNEKFVLAPVFLKMLSDSNTIDMAMLPVQKMIEKADDGSLVMTKNAVAMFKKEIQNEAEQLIQQLNYPIEDTIQGWNEGDNTSKQLFVVAALLDTRDGEISNSIKARQPSLSDFTIQEIREGKQRYTLLSPGEASRVRIGTSQTALVELITKEEAEDDVSGTFVAITNNGLNTIDKINGLELLEGLGENFVSARRQQFEGGKKPFNFSYRGTEYFTRSWKLVTFMKGESSAYILKYNMDIENEAEVVEDVVLSKKTDAELAELLNEKVASEEFEIVYSIQKIQHEREQNVLVDLANSENEPATKKRYTINTSVKDELTRRLLSGMTWEQATKEKFNYETDKITKEVLMLSLEEVIEKKQMQEINDFMIMLEEENAMGALPSAIKRGLREVQDDKKGGVSHIETDDTKKLMPLFNFKASDRDYNIAQVFLNQSINARSFNNILSPNMSMSFTDMFKDYTKRAKSYHASGTNFATETIDVESGIFHKVKDLDVLTIKDPEYKKMFDNIKGLSKFKGKPGEEADAQMVMTSKGYRYTAYADGRLSKQEVAILDKVDAGKPLTTAEVRGTRNLRGGLLFTTSESAVKRQQWINKLQKAGGNIVIISVEEILAELQGVVEPSSLIPVAYAKAEVNAVKALKAGKLVVFDSANETTEGIVLRNVIAKSIKKQLKQNVNVYHENIDKTKVEGLEGVTKFNIKAVENRGLKKLNGFMNSKKFVYADGKTYYKVSVLTLTKELTSVRAGEVLNEQTGKMDVVWKAREGRKKWHILREKLEAHESEVDEDGNLVRETLAMAVFASGSKMMKKNVMDHKDAFAPGMSIAGNMNVENARWMRRQMVNPSNKLEIVDPTQIKHILSSEQMGDIMVTIGSKEMPISEVMEKYHKTTGARIDNKYMGRRNLVFTMETALREIGNSKATGKATVNLTKFMDYAIKGLESSQARTQMLSFFATENGTPVFNLNNTITEREFEKLFLAFFSKDILAEKQHGVSVALATSYGYKLVKRVVELDENGQPKRWDVIRSDVWEAMKAADSMLKVKHPAFENEEDQLFHPKAMTKGDYYLDVLRHDVMGYKSNGEESGVKYSEFIMPSHFRELDEWLLKNNGAIPPEVAKAFGIRIPSQDDHSAINLRMVDTMPAIYGSTAIFSTALIEISGADFDIDKLYMQLAEFYEKGGKFFEYGKATTLKGQYKDYIRHTIKDYGNKKSAVFMATEQWSDIGNTVPVISERTIESFNKKSGEEYTVEEIMASDKKIKAVIVHQILEQHDDISEEQIAQLFKRSEDLRGGLELLGLPVTYNDYKKYRADKELSWMDNTKLEKYSSVSEPYTGAQSNAILDYKMALLGHRGKTEAKGKFVPSGYQAADLVALEDMLGQIEHDLPQVHERKLAQNYDPFSMLGAGVYFKVGKKFSEGIGAIVQPNVLINILSEHAVSLIERKNSKGKDQTKGYVLNGTEYRSFVKEFALLHNQGIKQGKNVKEYRKQYVISALITAMTDNAKEQLAGRLGIVKDSLPTLATMIAMGVDIKTSIYIINHPSIELMYNEVSMKSKMEAGFDKRINDRIRYIYENVINQKEGEELGKPPVTTELLIDHINKVGQLNPAESSMSAGYGAPETGSPYQKMDLIDAMVDLSVLEVYQKVRGYTKFLRNAATIINITKGLGKDTSTIEEIRLAAEELGLDLTDAEMENQKLPSTGNVRPFDLRGIFNTKNTFQGRSYEIVKELGDTLLPKVLLNQTKQFRIIRKSLISNLSQRRELPSDEKRKLSSEVTKYLNAKAYQQWLLTDSDNASYARSLNNGFIYDSMGHDFTIESVVTEVLEYLTRFKKNNAFIQDHVILLNTIHEDNTTGLSKLFTNSWTTLPDADLVKLQNSMVDLYKDPVTRENVMHIIHYLLVKDGMQYSNESFLNVVPPSLIQHQLNSIDKVHELFLEDQIEDNSGGERYDAVFGATFDKLRFDFITGFTTSVTNSRLNHKINEGLVGSEINFEEIVLGGGTINIDYGQDETGTNTQLLSNKAKRVFAFQKDGDKHRYQSVYHAYEVLKGGTFNKKLYDKYKKNGGFGVNYKQKGVAEDKDLLKQLIFESIRRNADNIDLIDALLDNNKFTITEKSSLNGVTIESLEEARNLIVFNPDAGVNMSRDEVVKHAKHKESLQKGSVRVEFLDEDLMLFDFIGQKTDDKESNHFVQKRKDTAEEKAFNKAVSKELRRSGLKSITGINVGDKKIMVQFPYVITVKAEDKWTGGIAYRTYKLRGVVRAGDKKENEELITQNSMNSEGAFWGVKASYERTEHLGSRQHKGPGYAFAGEIPPYIDLRALEDEKKVQRGKGQLGEDTDMRLFNIKGNSYLASVLAEKVRERQKGMEKEVAFAEGANIVATDRGFNVKGWTAVTGKESDTKTPKKRPAVSKDEFDDADIVDGPEMLEKDELLEDYSQTTGEVIGGTSEVSEVDKSNIGFLKGQNDDSDSLSKKDTTKVKAYLLTLNTDQEWDLLQHYEVRGMKDLLLIFEDVNYKSTADEFIDQLKTKC